MKYLIISIFLSLSVASCKSESKDRTKAVEENNKSEQTATDEIKYVKSILFSAPLKDSVWKRNTKVPVVIFHRRENLKIDSLQLYVDGKLKKVLYKEPFQCFFNFTKGKVGKRQLKAIAFHKDNKRGVATVNINVIPDEAPKKYGYKIVKTYKHDPKAYTQGLVFKDGYLYESTGQKGESSIRKVDLEKNEILSVLNIDNNLFGEGIAIVNDKIIQLTWMEMRGFVYDLKSFSLESEFHYSTQGWGITTIGQELVMSDGSNKLYFIDPSSFYVKRQIEVYDQKGAVDSLNELEYINGMIYANVWMTDKIVMIDPETGIVKGELNMAGLLTQQERSKLDDDDVLNGIAYDHDKKRLFVTGKRWNKLFHIELK